MCSDCSKAQDSAKPFDLKSICSPLSGDISREIVYRYVGDGPSTQPIVLHTQYRRLSPESALASIFGHLRLWQFILIQNEDGSSLTISGLPACGSKEWYDRTSGCRDVEAIVQMPLRAVFLQLASCNACSCSTSHLPKQSSPGFLGESFFRSSRTVSFQSHTTIFRYAHSRL